MVDNEAVFDRFKDWINRNAPEYADKFVFDELPENGSTYELIKSNKHGRLDSPLSDLESPFGKVYLIQERYGGQVFLTMREGFKYKEEEREKMIRQTLYPKTTRIGKSEYTVTEKLDGSNLGIFKWNGELVVAQRNIVFTWSPQDSTITRGASYKGLFGWLEEHGESLLESLIDGSGFFGEWIAMGQLKYDLPHRLYIFAKANIIWNKASNLYDARNIYYDRSLFIYPFKEQAIPDFIGVVPQVAKLNDSPTIEVLDKLYDEYLEKIGRASEGFIIISGNNITKYVRNKGGGLTEHLLPR